MPNDGKKFVADRLEGNDGVFTFYLLALERALDDVKQYIRILQRGLPEDSGVKASVQHKRFMNARKPYKNAQDDLPKTIRWLVNDEMGIQDALSIEDGFIVTMVDRLVQEANVSTESTEEPWITEDILQALRLIQDTVKKYKRCSA